MRIVYFIIILLAVSALAHPATLNVPTSYPTIQGAINAAAHGDTVLVDDGTYVENIDFIGMAITVMSVNGAGVTIIDGNQNGSVVIFQGGEALDSVLDGFTITNGTGTWYAAGSDYRGGGISCWDYSSPTIINNIICMNSVEGSGGGIYCINNASPSIIDNIISNNSTGTVGGGGGICCWDASPTISNNLISQNTAWYSGGIFLGPKTPSVMNNIITENTATSYGGGMYCNGSNAVVMGNTISENTTYYGGGGIWITGGDSSAFTNNMISSNSVSVSGNYWGGGGIGSYQSTPIITNSILTGNSSAGAGGAITLGEGSNATITNNSIYKNIAEYGGGVYCFASDPTITNTILWNNQAPLGPEMAVVTTSSPSSLTISYSDVDGGKPSVHVSPGCNLIWGPGMIDADPLFVDGPGGDLHIRHHSPCCDTGDNACSSLPVEDFEGDPRICYGTADMGADEHFRHLYYTGDATPGGNVDVILTGLPGTNPVGLIVGFGLYDPPLTSMWGDWYVMYPWFGPIVLGLMPTPDGVLIINGLLPGTPPGPYSIYMQAIIGDKLTNLCTMDVK